MNPVAIQSIWQAIQESERSDELRFTNGVARCSNSHFGIWRLRQRPAATRTRANRA